MTKNTALSNYDMMFGIKNNISHQEKIGVKIKSMTFITTIIKVPTWHSGLSSLIILFAKLKVNSSLLLTNLVSNTLHLWLCHINNIHISALLVYQKPLISNNYFMKSPKKSYFWYQHNLRKKSLIIHITFTADQRPTRPRVIFEITIDIQHDAGEPLQYLRQYTSNSKISAETPVKFQCDWGTRLSNLFASKPRVIWRYKSSK